MGSLLYDNRDGRNDRDEDDRSPDIHYYHPTTVTAMRHGVKRVKEEPTNEGDASQGDALSVLQLDLYMDTQA